MKLQMQDMKLSDQFAGHENEDMKMTDQYAGHEIAVREIAGTKMQA